MKIQCIANDLGLTAEDQAAKVVRAKQFVPEVHGNCEFIEGSAVDSTISAFLSIIIWMIEIWVYRKHPLRSQYETG